MAKLEIPVVIDGVKSIEELANRVLDEYEFKGKTIREWADRIANPETNGDNLRSMTDEDLAEFLCHAVSPSGVINCSSCEAQGFCKMGHNGWLDWLKQEAEK